MICFIEFFTILEVFNRQFNIAIRFIDDSVLCCVVFSCACTDTGREMKYDINSTMAIKMMVMSFLTLIII